MAVATASGTTSTPGMSVNFNLSNTAPVNSTNNNNSPNNNNNNNGSGGASSSSCTIQSLLQTAKKLAERMTEHDNNVEHIITQTREVNKTIESMQKFKDEVDAINENNRPRPYSNHRARMIKGIQYENRQIKSLQRENEELKLALEEHQNAMELIMSKYREHVSTLSQYARLDFASLNTINQQEIEQKNAKILEMVSVMQQVVRLDENSACAAEKKIAQLEHENRTLRELLFVSKQFQSRIRLVSSNPYALPAMPGAQDLITPNAPQTGENSPLSDDNSENGNSDQSPNFDYPSKTVKKRPSLGLSGSNSNSVAALFSAENASFPSANPNSMSVSSGSFFGDQAPMNSGHDASIGSNNVPNDVVMNGMPEDQKEASLVNGPSNINDYIRGGVPNKLNSYDGVPQGNEHDSGSNFPNHLHGNGVGGGGGGGMMKYRYGSETDIISDTDSDSSSNASTVTLTPCTSDREDDDEGRHCAMDAESLGISTTRSSVAEEVEQFSKAASNCLTNGCFDPDFHNANTSAASLNQNSAASVSPLTPENEASLPNGIA